MHIKIGQFLRLFTDEDSSDGNCRIVNAVTSEGRRPGPSERRDAAPGRPFFASRLCSVVAFPAPAGLAASPVGGEESDQRGGRGFVVIITGRLQVKPSVEAFAGLFLALRVVFPAMWFRTRGPACGESESSLRLRSWLRGSWRPGGTRGAGAGWRGLPLQAAAWPAPSAPLRRWRPRLSRGLSFPPGPVGSSGQGCGCPCPARREPPWP